MSELIFHLIPSEEWENLEEDEYRPKSLEDEGFIHFCEKDQIETILEFEEESREDLVALCVEKSEIEDDYTYENDFPHLYRGLKIDEVSDVRNIDEVV